MKDLLMAILEKTTFEKFMESIVDFVVTLFLGIIVIVCILSMT